MSIQRRTGQDFWFHFEYILCMLPIFQPVILHLLFDYFLFIIVPIAGQIKTKAKMNNRQYNSIVFGMVVIATMPWHVIKGQVLDGKTFTGVLTELANQGLGVADMQVRSPTETTFPKYSSETFAQILTVLKLLISTWNIDCVLQDTRCSTTFYIVFRCLLCNDTIDIIIVQVSH